MRSILLYFLGIPIPIIILIALFVHLNTFSLHQPCLVTRHVCVALQIAATRILTVRCLLNTVLRAEDNAVWWHGMSVVLHFPPT